MSAAGHISSLGPAEAQLDGPPDPEGQKRGWAGYLLLLPGGLWLLLFFVVPTVTLVATSLYDPAGSLQLGYQMTWHWQNYVDALQDYGPQFVRSLIYAGIATIACILLGFPLAYAIAFKAGRYKNLMLVAVIAPFFTSFLIRTLSWQYILGDNEPLVSLLRTLHILGPDGYLLATPFAVVTGLTYNFLPFMVLPIYASLERADPRVIEAGGDLYANGFTTFRTVTLPMSMPGVLAGTLLTFIPAAGDFVNMELLGPQRGKMVGNVINDQFLAIPGGYPVAAALSFTLMAAILVMVFLYVRRFGTEELV